jgi:hypothetical protein
MFVSKTVEEARRVCSVLDMIRKHGIESMCRYEEDEYDVDLGY